MNSNRPRGTFAALLLFALSVSTPSLKAQGERSIARCEGTGPCVEPAPASYALPTELPALKALVQEEMKASASLRLLIAGQHAQVLSAADIASMRHKTVTFRNVHTKADESYSGVPLTDLLAKYEVATGDKLRGKALSEYIIATGRDGYKAVLALAETDPAFHPGDVIVADTIDGKPIGDKDGPFRLVVTEDKRPARCVHNLVSIELRTVD